MTTPTTHTTNLSRISAPGERSGTTRRTRVLSGTESWRRLLNEEDQRCERTGFQAGIISINHGPVGPDTGRTSTIIRVVHETIGRTDQACILNDDEIAILMIPVTTSSATRQLAHRIDAELRTVGISAAIGFALRRNDGAGLRGAHARADAGAATAHARKLRIA